MGGLKNVNVDNSLADVEDCLTSLPGTGGTITAEIQAKIDKAIKAVAHLKKVLSADTSAAGVDSCARRPVVRGEGQL